jgi:hypothetical protein
MLLSAGLIENSAVKKWPIVCRAPDYLNLQQRMCVVVKIEQGLTWKKGKLKKDSYLPYPTIEENSFFKALR